MGAYWSKDATSPAVPKRVEGKDDVDENDLLPDGRKLPYWVEKRGENRKWKPGRGLDADTSVTVDGDLITARGPESSHEGR